MNNDTARAQALIGSAKIDAYATVAGATTREELEVVKRQYEEMEEDLKPYLVEHQRCGSHIINTALQTK